MSKEEIKARRFVIGCPYEVEDIDPEKSKKIDRDRFYRLHNDAGRFDNQQKE